MKAINIIYFAATLVVVFIALGTEVSRTFPYVRFNNWQLICAWCLIMIGVGWQIHLHEKVVTRREYKRGVDEMSQEIRKKFYLIDRKEYDEKFKSMVDSTDK